MKRKEFEIPTSVLGNIMSFTFYKTDIFKEVTLSNKYEDMEITIRLEKSNKMDSLINLYIRVVTGSSSPATFRFDFMHHMDLFKAYLLNLKSGDILLRFIPQGGKLKEQEYILFRPLIENGMSVTDLTNFTSYISFNDEIDLCYLCYNLLLNNHFIIFEPSNVRTDLNLKSLLIDKFDYYGYNMEFLEDNKHLKVKESFGTSQIALDTFIVYVLAVLLNNDKSGLDNTFLKHLYKVFFTLFEKEKAFGLIK